jgi:hypothetical protein
MAAATQAKPHILLISIDLQPWFDEMYASLINEISENAAIKRAQKPAAAIRALSQDTPKAVLLTDAALTTRKHTKVWDAVLEYVRGGGTAICMGTFTSFVKPLNIKPFFQRAGLPWERGNYERTTVALDKNHVPSDYWPFIPEAYSQKAVFLKNVDDAAAWYHPNDDSVIESLVYAPTKVSNPHEVPVALAKVGEGKLGYVGDVNAEEGSRAVVLAMCGLYTSSSK